MLSDSVVVIDNGSGSCKAGLAGDDKPKAVIPSVVGRPSDESLRKADYKDTYVGKDAVDKRDVLALHYPIHRGIIQNWEDMEALWTFMFTALKINPENSTVLIVGNSESNQKNRTKMYEILFEKFQVQGIQNADENMMSLYASGRKTGIVCTSGDSFSNIVPIYEGFQLPEAEFCLPLGGRDLNNYLMKMLIENGSFEPKGDYIMDLLNDVREKHSYIASDFEKELNVEVNSLQRNFSFQDGHKILIDKERFMCNEPLFKPTILEIESTGLPDLIYRSIMKCDMDIRKDLYHNVVLAGGLTMTTGFVERIEKELGFLVPSTIKIQISAPIDRAISSWVGGSLLATSTDFHQRTMPLQQYKECGLSNI